MIELLTSLCWIIVITVGLPLFFLVIECLIGLLPIPAKNHSTSKRPAVGVLIPAHNEESVLTSTLSNVKSQLQSEDRLVVIADNCSDATAKLAHGMDVEVIERHDLEHRGKGYALAAGIAHFRADPPAILIIVDADCRLSEGSIDALACQVSATDKPAQAIYLMYPNSATDVLAKVSAFAFLVKNQARPRGLAQLNQPVLLTGTGMAFPWHVLENVDLATGDIVEDLSLSIKLTVKGQGPLLCPKARVESTLPTFQEAAVTQRTRWEHGYLKTLFRHAPRLLAKGILELNPRLILLALELSIPPLSLLMTVTVASLIATTLAALVTQSWLPALSLAYLIGLLGVTLALVWGRFGRQFLPLRTLIAIPLYLLWKLPIYLRFLTNRETSWIRTER